MSQSDDEVGRLTTTVNRADHLPRPTPVGDIFTRMASCCSWMSWMWTGRKDQRKPRQIPLGLTIDNKFPANVMKTEKYNFVTFVPLVLLEQFKLFVNLIFLIMACSQFFQCIRVGYWYTYWGPLIFVMTTTLIRQAVDDMRRRKNVNEINRQKYEKITAIGGRISRMLVPSSAIKVGDVIVIEKDQRVPADMVLLRTSDRNGRCFIRTDQLDGETEWKLRLPVLQPDNSALEMRDSDLFPVGVSVYAERPQVHIQSFIGRLHKTVQTGPNLGDTIQEDTRLNVENTLWANTFLATGTAVGLVIYTGTETRSVMRTSVPRSKVGLIDLEINHLMKILLATVTVLALLMMCLKGWDGLWFFYLLRFVLLFSYIVLISLRVNMDMAKTVYTLTIQGDTSIAGTIVRSTSIPEDLGRISYLLTDKTGTLTQNEIVFRRLWLATGQIDSSHEVRDKLFQGLKDYDAHEAGSIQGEHHVTEVTQVFEAIKALALCHSVTPIHANGNPDDEINFGMDQEATYQASSQDEIALVNYAKDVGLRLVRRDTNRMELRSSQAGISLDFEILQIFPFTSEAQRMGIIVKESNGDILFYSKGADVTMRKSVKDNDCDWLDNACATMSQEGLRTLVVAKRRLEFSEYAEFEKKYNSVRKSEAVPAALMTAVVAEIEVNMDLLCVTGMEDTLQDDVEVTMETLRNAGIRIWMLTGDKMEIATCVAKSSKLVATDQNIHVFNEFVDRTRASEELLEFHKKSDSAIAISGESLDVCLQYYEKEFMELACDAPAVIVGRCPPIQKARLVALAQKYTGKRIAAVGDGGNDVSMVQAADTGIGIEGNEGRQASLAADFSITHFSFIAALLLVHGRYAYKRSAALAKFVMHRGLIIAVMQAVFSSIFSFSSIALFQGVLLIGYATVYTMLPVFALVLDKDMKAENLLRLPQLYSDLGKGWGLTYKTFLTWVVISIYQGGIIMYGALVLFQEDFMHVVSISFTSLIITELIMVALTIRTMYLIMVIVEVVSLLAYVSSLFIFHQVFDTKFMFSWSCIWRTTLITVASCAPMLVPTGLTVIRYCITRLRYSRFS